MKRAPWWKIVWRALWFIPAWFTLAIWLAVVLIGWGPQSVKYTASRLGLR